MEEIKLYIDDAKEKMDKAIIHLDQVLSKLRAGKADPNLLSGISVDYYGTRTPLAQVASITTPDAKTITIQPWEKSMIEVIEKAILAANIGITPMNNGEMVKLFVPPLTEDRRKELVKQIKHEGEIAKVSIRNVRRDVMEEFKKMKKDGLSEDDEKKAEAKIQEITDFANKKVDEHMTKKEKEVMTV